MKSIIFFDQYCPLCRRTINFLVWQDRKKRFQFAALDGKTAERMFLSNLAHLRTLNTVLLVEQPSGKIWIRGRAVFRVLWLLGRWWKLIGWLYEMPFVDLAYKFVAKHRKKGGDLRLYLFIYYLRGLNLAKICTFYAYFGEKEMKIEQKVHKKWRFWLN